MKSIATETKVGTLVLAAAVALGWLSYQSGTIAKSGLSNMRVLDVAFTNADGIGVGSKVKIAGVQVGEISGVRLGSGGEAIVSIAVRPDVTLPANIKAQITSSGLIGERFIALTTDFAPEGQLADDSKTIPALPTADIGDIGNQFAGISADLKEVSTALRQSMGGQENAEKLSRIVNNLDAVSTRMNGILNQELEPGKINGIVNNIYDVTEELKGDDVRSIVTDLKAASKSLRQILESNQGEASGLIANLSVTAENLAAITEKLAAGQGTIGQLLNDDSVSKDLKIAMNDLRNVADKLNSGEGSIGKLINDSSTVDKLENALDNFSAFSQRVDAFRTEVDFHGYTLLGEDVGKGRFNITLRPRPSRYYVLGVTADGFATEAGDKRNTNGLRGQDFGDDLKFTAQFGHVYENAIFGQDIGMRVGLKDSAFGIGLDVEPEIMDYFVSLSADLYDFTGENSGTSNENPHLDLTARVNLINKNIYGMVGVDNALNDRYAAPFVGLGFRFADDDFKYLANKAL
ncbi:MAG: MCE family protein [Proteobacteria bacterium]|nr:MCE family protein [Pseudomonadota bacterium]